MSDLLDAIGEELHGRPFYRPEDEHIVALDSMQADHDRELAAEAMGETTFQPYEAVNAPCPF